MASVRSVGSWRLLSLALAGTAALLARPERAEACGGLFCNSAAPVNQRAERIIFAQNPDGTVTAVIEVQYQGPSEEFAWLLPVAGNPRVGVSSTGALDRLQAATNPFYQLTTTVEGECEDDGLRFAAAGGDSSGGADAGAPPPADPEVTVLASGTVGPYDYVTISVEAGAADVAEVALEWLTTNGYDVSDFGADRLRPYMEAGMNLVAFRLTKGNDSGAIRPILIDFGDGLPSIPIRPTAVAANEDMGILVWVLGSKRAIPANYLSLELNEALINWLNPSANYNDVVIQAANEAGGQGFVTELAAPTDTVGRVMYPEWMESQVSSLEATDWTGREGELLGVIASSLPGADGAMDLLEAHLDLELDPATGAYPGLSCGSYPEGYRTGCWGVADCADCLVLQADIEGFDPVAFLADLREQVIEPLERTQEIFDQNDYMTRFYTTMSPDEMTVDPMFNYNEDLGDYSNNHVAERVIECNPWVTRNEARWRIRLPDGTTVYGRGGAWPFATDDEDFPAMSIARRVGTEGAGSIVIDNRYTVSQAVAAHNSSVSDGGTCAVSAVPGRGGRAYAGALVLLGVALAGIAGLGRRRRRG